MELLKFRVFSQILLFFGYGNFNYCLTYNEGELIILSGVSNFDWNFNNLHICRNRILAIFRSSTIYLQKIYCAIFYHHCQIMMSSIL